MSLSKLISEREKKLFSVIILLAALIIAYAFVIKPVYIQYLSLNQEIRARQDRLAKNLGLLKQKNFVQEEFKKYSRQFKPQGSEEEEMAAVLTEIERIGKTTGIYLSDVKPQKVSGKDFYKVMFVEIRFQANMQLLTKFLYELQKSALLLKPSRLQINSAGAEQGLLEGTIQISRVFIS